MQNGSRTIAVDLGEDHGGPVGSNSSCFQLRTKK